jgi:hypothetical protein
VTTDLQRLLNIRTAILTALETHGAKPSYVIDGQTVNWDSLFDRLDKINAQIAALQGPVEEISEGYV